MRIDEVVLSMNEYIVPMEYRSSGRLSEFKFRVGDKVRHIDNSNMVGVITRVYFVHERPDVHFGDFRWFMANDDDVNCYQDFINVLEEEGMDPFGHWYGVLWEERGEDGGYEGEEAEGSLRLWVKFSPRVV